MNINQSRNRSHFFLVSLLCLFFISCVQHEYSHDNSIGTGYYQQYPSNYQNYSAPRSRIYNNPYKSPPVKYYPYYDYDYYYVPPSEYRNIEPDRSSGPDNTKY